jgi:hypothetical protein
VGSWWKGADADHPRFWARAEYLLWWVKDQPVSVPLVTTSNPIDLGLVNRSSTVVLFGNDYVGEGTFNGARATVGYQCNSILGIEASGFLLSQNGTAFGTGSDTTGNPLLAVPFVTPFFLLERSNILASPGVQTGGVVADLHTNLWSGELNLTALVYRNQTWSLQFLGGVRYADLHEGLGFNTTTTLLANPGVFNNQQVPIGSSFNVRDAFNTRNRYMAGQLGFEAEATWSRFFINVRGQLALGNTHEELNISGNSNLLLPGQTTPAATVNSGFFALSSNSGHYNQNEFAIMPEGRVNVGFRITNSVSVFAGYTFLYWSDVIRPGEQIDRRVNTNLVPTFNVNPPIGLASPPPAVLKNSDFFAHGFSFGVSFRY